jgi:hypothetical protein
MCIEHGHRNTWLENKGNCSNNVLLLSCRNFHPQYTNHCTGSVQKQYGQYQDAGFYIDIMNIYGFVT